VKLDGGYSNLRRRAMRSSLIANGPRKNPTIASPSNAILHPTSPPSGPAGRARNAIGITAPATAGIYSPGMTHPLTGVGVIGTAAKSSIGGNVGELRHEIPHPVPMATAATHPTGLSGAAMGRPATSPAALGGPAHITSGIGGASFHPKR
jgi:hypothetical protein